MIPPPASIVTLSRTTVWAYSRTDRLPVIPAEARVVVVPAEPLLKEIATEEDRTRWTATLPRLVDLLRRGGREPILAVDFFYPVGDGRTPFAPTDWERQNGEDGTKPGAWLAARAWPRRAAALDTLSRALGRGRPLSMALSFQHVLRPILSHSTATREASIVELGLDPADFSAEPAGVDESAFRTLSEVNKKSVKKLEEARDAAFRAALAGVRGVLGARFRATLHNAGTLLLSPSARAGLGLREIPAGELWVYFSSEDQLALVPRISEFLRRRPPGRVVVRAAEGVDLAGLVESLRATGTVVTPNSTLAP